MSAAAAEPAPAPSDDQGAAWFAAYDRESRFVALPDGRTLNLYCVGNGSPTVVLESGISESAYSWWKVHDRIAERSRVRVCAYDRAGMGRSPNGPPPRDTAAEVADLAALLKAADIGPPYVLVGHSMGGYNVRLFASLHRTKVSGLVLVDPSVENQIPILEAALPRIAAGDKNARSFSRFCADPKLVAAEFKDKCVRSAPSTFPKDLAARYEAAQTTAHYQALDSEIQSFLERDSQEVIAHRRSFGSMPLIVLTRGELSSNMSKEEGETEHRIWTQLHDQVASLSRRGVNRTVEGSGHYIQLDKPDAVVDAVAEMVNAARASRRR